MSLYGSYGKSEDIFLVLASHLGSSWSALMGLQLESRPSVQELCCFWRVHIGFQSLPLHQVMMGAASSHTLESMTRDTLLQQQSKYDGRRFISPAVTIYSILEMWNHELELDQSSFCWLISVTNYLSTYMILERLYCCRIKSNWNVAGSLL